MKNKKTEKKGKNDVVVFPVKKNGKTVDKLPKELSIEMLESITNPK